MNTPTDSRKDGGAAFPRLKSSAPRRENGMERVDGLVDFNMEGGMTLRDYFAAKALTLVEIKSSTESEWPEVAALCARFAYVMADAMLAARSKP